MDTTTFKTELDELEVNLYYTWEEDGRAAFSAKAQQVLEMVARVACQTATGTTAQPTMADAKAVLQHLLDQMG